MTRRQKVNVQVSAGLILIVIALVLGQLAACRSSHRTDTLRAAVISLNVARDGFVAWDLQHQKSIVEKATTREDGEVNLIAYRAKRDSVTMSFEAAYRAVALAATQSDDPSLKSALAATAKILELLDNVKGGP